MTDDSVRAWRAPGQLGAASVVTPLLELLDDEELDDWLREEPPGFSRRSAPPSCGS